MLKNKVTDLNIKNIEIGKRVSRNHLAKNLEEYDLDCFLIQIKTYIPLNILLH